MDVLLDVLGFSGKALVVFLTFTACVVVLFARFGARQQGDREDGRLKIRHLNRSLEAKVNGLRAAMLDRKARRAAHKQEKAAEKHRVPKPRRVFVLDFKGDVMASRVESLRDEITALLGVATKEDEVVLRLESPGGAAHSYGLAASQLARLRSASIPLTVCVDRVAASGGYMMACVADKVVAAPFAIVGSIGVAAPLPNVHRLLDKLGVDFENATAGQYKRTVSPFAAVDPEGRQKFQDQIEEVHTLFKRFVGEHRPGLDIEAVATGEAWPALRAVELGLVNELATSDDYLVRQLDRADIWEIKLDKPEGLRKRVVGSLQEALTVLRPEAWG